MNIRPLAIGIMLSAALVVTGCNKHKDATSDNASTMSSNTAGTETSPTVGAKVDDTVITTKVKSALLADSNVKGLDIHVDTVDGNVKLSGTVGNAAQIDSALQVTKGVEGVKNVDNQLKAK